MARGLRALAAAGVLAATTTFADPAAAATLPEGPAPGAAAFAFSRHDSAAATANWHCRWGCGWGRGWGRHRGWRRNRIDAGDVLIGAAIIGGAIAIANSNNRRRERDVVIVERDVREPDWRDRDWRDDDRRYDDRRFDDRRAAVPRGSGASGLDNAVDLCLDRIARDVRVDTVDTVERTGAGWRVAGTLFNGAPFDCRIGNSGQIDAIDYGEGFRGVGLSDAPAPRAVDAPPAPGQWDDSRYASARAALGGTVRPDMALTEAPLQPAAAAPPVRVASAAERMPAYPGGPIPGEVIPEDMPEPVDGDL